MGIPLIQQFKVATYIAGRKLRRDRRYPLVLMLEPLFQCNLACAGCGKIDYPKEILQKRVSLEDALKAAGLTEAQIAVVKMLHAPGAPHNDPVPIPDEPTPEVVVPTGEPRTCIQHRGAYHVAARYGLLPDTPTTKKVLGFCSCGYRFKNLVKCPHQQQSLPGGRTGPVVCNWCSSIVYGGTGATGLDEALAKQQTSLPDVNPDAFMGNL